MAYKEKAVAYKYNNAFIKDNYERINLTVPKGAKEKIKAKAESQGESVNGYIYRLITEDLANTFLTNNK